ncbi:MAG: VanZ family protein [Nonlabens sp.]
MIVVYGSLTPNPDLPVVMEDHSDKIYHGNAYFLLFFAWYSFFKNRFFSVQQMKSKYVVRDLFRFNRSIAIGTGVLCFSVGVIIELAQGYLAQNRSMDFYDVIANTVGILFASLILKAITHFWLGTNKSKAF